MQEEEEFPDLEEESGDDWLVWPTPAAEWEKRKERIRQVLPPPGPHAACTAGRPCCC